MDRYLKDIPSIQKTLRGFHAKNDCPEVRKAVFETLDKLDFSVQVIVARKLEPLFVSRHKQSQDAFYNDLTSKLFERQLHLASQNTITFARRGNKVNQHALRAAVDAGIAAFRRKYLNATSTSVSLETALPPLFAGNKDPYARRFPRWHKTEFEAWGGRRAVIGVCSKISLAFLRNGATVSPINQ